MVALGQFFHGQNLRTVRKWSGHTHTHTHTLLHINFFGHVEVVASGLTLLQTHTDTQTHRLLHINFFGHAEVVASGLTLLQPIIKNVHTDTVIALQALLRRLVIKSLT